MRSTLLTLAALTLSLSPAFSQQGSNVIAFVERAEGKILVKEPSGATHSVQRWDPLHLNDIVIPGSGGSLVIRYQNGTRTITSSSAPGDRKIKPLAGSSNDTNSRVMRAIFDSGRRAFSKASVNARTGTRPGPIEIPMVEALLPRGTTLGHTVRFRWFSGKPGTVTVTLTDSSGNVMWTKDSQVGTSIVYPSTEAALKPGEEYTWTVQTGDEKSSATFSVVTSDIAKSVETGLAQLNSIKFVDDESRRVARASLLLDRGLYSEAVQELQLLPDGRESMMVKALKAEAWTRMDEPYMKVEAKHLIPSDNSLIQRWDDSSVPSDSKTDAASDH